MSGGFKLLLNAVDNPESPHLISELAQQFSIDEDTSSSIMKTAPIVLLEGIEIEVVALVKKRHKKMVSLGAQLIITDDDFSNAPEEIPKINWPELPEIAVQAQEELEDIEQKKASTTSAAPSTPTTGPAVPLNFNQQGNLFVSPDYTTGFYLMPLPQDKLEELKAQGEIVLANPLRVETEARNFKQAPAEAPPPAETTSTLEPEMIMEDSDPIELDPESGFFDSSSLPPMTEKEEEVTEAPEFKEESSLDLGGLQISEEKVLPGESSELMALAGDTQALNQLLDQANKMPGLVEDSSHLNPASDVELEVEEQPIIDFQMAGEEEQLEMDDLRPMESTNTMLPELDIEEEVKTLSDDQELAFSDDDPISFEDDDIEELEEFEEDEDLEDLENLARFAQGPIDEQISPMPTDDMDDDSIMMEEEEDSEVDLEALSPDKDWETDVHRISDDGMSVLDSDDSFNVVDQISSDEMLIQEMLPLYEASHEPLDPEEALRLLQSSKGESIPVDLDDFDDDDDDGSMALEALDPSEALNLLKAASGPAPSNGSSVLELVTSKKSKKPVKKKTSGRSPKFQKLQTSKKSSPGEVGGVAEGDGPHGVVLSRINAEEKRERAANLIAEVKNISVKEAMKMTSKTIIPVLRGVSKDVADDVYGRFKSIGITARVTTRKD